MYQYSTPPAYVAFEYRTPPLSPSPTYGYGYSTRFNLHTATPSPRASPKMHGHARRSSHQEPGYAYASPRMPSYYSTGGYPSPIHFSTLPRNPDYMRSSSFDRTARRGRSAKGGDYASGGDEDRSRSRSSGKHHQSQYFLNVVVDDDYPHGTPPPPYDNFESFRTNDYYSTHEKVPVYAEPEPATARRSRARRRASHAPKREPTTLHDHEDGKTPTTHHYSAKPAYPTPSASPVNGERKASPPRATEEDARRAGIPAGYSYKNWDPTETPILLLGSVFDANSLGKWIYDWTVFHHGSATPLSEVAGELWLLLIQLAGKVKRAEACMSKIRKQSDRELVEDFLESGERLWVRFEKLLKVCEDYMWRVARKQSGSDGKRSMKNVTMGKNSGCAFVDAIFGRDRELEKTEKLMTGMRLWSMRFDANCESILRRPSA